MSSPRASNRRVSDTSHTDKADTDKKKHVSKHSGTKNGTHGKSESRRRASIGDHTKSDTKKHISVDPHTRSTHATGSTHNSGTTKSHGTTAKHGKVVERSGSDSPGKVTTHNPAKKSDVHKPRTTKKSESDKNDSHKGDHKGTTEEIITAVSYDAEKSTDAKSDENNEN